MTAVTCLASNGGRSKLRLRSRARGMPQRNERFMKLRQAMLGLGMLAGALAFTTPAGAHEPETGVCAGEEYAVIGDRADWAAVELVGWVLATDCLLDSGDRRDDALPADTLARYGGQVGYVVGGAAAVPDAKLGSLRVLERLWGTDRLETMRAVVEWADNWTAHGDRETADQQTGTVRMLYVVPSDRDFRDEHSEAINRAMTDLQVWYRGQLGGATFTLHAAQPERCQTRQPDAHYFQGPWDKLLQDVQHCFSVADGRPDDVWVIFADVGTHCDDHYSIGGGTPGLAIVARDALEGLMGTRLDDSVACGGPWDDTVNRWIGVLGHELGHALTLLHPPGCDDSDPACDTRALMWQGPAYYPDTHLRAEEKQVLLRSPVFRLF